MTEAPRDAREIFLTFARIGLSGFGGVLYWMRRVLIQEKRWVTVLGFMLASCWLLLNSVAIDWRHYALALAALGVALHSKISPLWLLGIGGVLGMAGLV
jgi:chromate transport protein ChrA